MGDLLTGLAIGVCVGGLAAAAVLLVLQIKLRGQLAEARSRATMLDGQSEEQQRAINELQDELIENREQRIAADKEAAVLQETVKARDKQIILQREQFEQADARTSDAFGNLSAKALAHNNKQFIELAGQQFAKLLTEAKGEDEKTRQSVDNIVKPIRELLDKQNTTLTELDKRWTGEKSGIEAKLKLIAEAHQSLSGETGRLVKALRRPEQRGRWGEVQLRNVVELAGMVEHCDFATQVQTDDPETRDRPDMAVNLPGEGLIVVDSKIALDAYLDAIESEDEASRSSALVRHAAQLESHVKNLAKKSYWEQFDRTPKLVVMFVSVESALVAALEQKPQLYAEAMENHVVIATPTLLVALLVAVAYGWQQEAIADNAREIADTGRDLYSRLSKFVGDIDGLGRRLSQATKTYNTAIGSFQSRVLPSARKLKDLGASSITDITPPSQVDVEVRPVLSDELRGEQDRLIENDSSELHHTE